MKKIIFTVFVVALLFEIALRLAGGIYYWLHTSSPCPGDNDKIKILCLGESTTFGLFVQKNEAYPAQLNRILDEKYPNRFIVYNRGTPGIISSLILLNLNHFIAETKPDFVILLCGANEFCMKLNATRSLLILEKQNTTVRNAIFNLSRFFWNLRIYRLSILIKDGLKYKFEYFCGAYINKRTEYDFFKQYNDPEIRLLLEKQYKFNMDKITEHVREKRLGIMYTTYLCPQLYKSMKALARANNVVFCDQVEMLKKENIPLSALVTKDGFHPNPQGHRIMAEFLLKTLEDSNIIKNLLDKAGSRT